MVCQRCDVETQRRDVTEACVFELFPHRDIETQRREVIEACVFEFFPCHDVTERVNLNFFYRIF